ncbi:MAG: hypothetical protein IPK03_01595 [Bacteroidetes bacterium]|nr:hypothetical protein [Bacteroidota bacterium]
MKKVGVVNDVIPFRNEFAEARRILTSARTAGGNKNLGNGLIEIILVRFI